MTELLGIIIELIMIIILVNCNLIINFIIFVNCNLIINFIIFVDYNLMRQKVSSSFNILMT